jgi:outer membrane protein assembly factor BamA
MQTTPGRYAAAAISVALALSACGTVKQGPGAGAENAAQNAALLRDVTAQVSGTVTQRRAHEFLIYVGFLGYRVEQVATTIDDPIAARGELPTPVTSRDGRIAALRGGLTYSTLDQPFLPTKGMSLGASIEVADPRWGSELQLTRFDGWASLHQAIGPLTLHLGGSVSTVSSRDAAGVPLSERLHLDRSSVIRGFAPGSIGPRDGATGLSLGGNFEYTGRAELEAPLVRAVGISAVGFVDHGGIYDIGGAGSNGTSVGFGLIWRSPIGPLRFDWAFPVAGDHSPHFVFGVGTNL